MLPSDRLDDDELRSAFEDILQTNEFANEYNYMLDAYNAIKNHYMTGTDVDGMKDDEKGWMKLFDKFGSK